MADIDAERIIGLRPAPWDADDWPTYGYDGSLVVWRDIDAPETLGGSGHTREEWLALADAMIARWTAWKAHVAGKE